MAKLSTEVRKAMDKTMPYCVATADKKGKPNLVYMTYLKAVDDQTIVLADNKFDKTRLNLDANPQLSFVVMDPDSKKAYQVKGRAKCYKEGQKYDETVEWVHTNHPQMTPKAAFYMYVDEVWSGDIRIA